MNLTGGIVAVLVGVFGAGGIGALLTPLFRRRLIPQEARAIDASARAEDARTDIAYSEEARKWLDEARIDVARYREIAAQAVADAAKAAADAAADRMARREQDDRIATLEGRVRQLEGVMVEAGMHLPPWPARRGYAH